jgi:ornithine decarboxylase
VGSGAEKQAFYICDPKSATERIDHWRHFLPRVQIFYAVKTNPNQKIIDKCIEKNTGFDIASAYEMRKVLASGGKPEECIYASPIKKVSDLLLAKELGIKMMTFDSIEELFKIEKHFPEAECVLRIATEATTALYNLSEKFGASMEEVPALLSTVKKLGLNLIGVAFHTGSGGVTFISYKSSLVNVRKIFNMVVKMGMKPLNLIDIGGGFTMVNPDQEKNFDFVAPLISSTLDQIFPERNIRIIAEPGRYISESAYYITSTIIGSKELPNGARHYYIDSGIYTSYGLRPYEEE